MSGDKIAPGWDCHVHVFDAQASVAPGHYQSIHRPLAEIEALAQSHGFGHLVLVQPSVYGTDNSLLLQALRASQGRHRGVVVIDATVSDAALQDMHQLGVRGVRFNLVSPAGNGAGAAQDFDALAPRLRSLGWHVQWYARPDDLPAIAALHEGSSLVAVLDHLAGLHAGLPSRQTAFSALEKLAALGAWVKLSGWYRLQAAPPYTALDDHTLQLASLFDERMVWGSDWPHTSFGPDALPEYASTLEPAIRTLSGPQKTSLWNTAPARLYA